MNSPELEPELMQGLWESMVSKLNHEDASQRDIAWHKETFFLGMQAVITSIEHFSLLPQDKFNFCMDKFNQELNAVMEELFGADVARFIEVKTWSQ